MKHFGSEKGQSIKILGLFCLAVGMLIGVSLTIKFATILAKSTFDGAHRFTILQEGNPARLYSFAPDEKTIAVVDIASPAKKGNIPILIDAVVKEEKGSDLSKKSPEPYLSHLFTHFAGIQTNMTILDVARLWLFSRDISEDAIRYEKLSLSEMQNGTAHALIGELFSDAAVDAESKSIQVVNGTGMAGVGNAFSTQLGNMGAHVVSVTTAQDEAKKTTIQYYGEKSYTLKKIESLLQTEAKPLQKQGISDIIVVLGKDWDKQAL